MDNKMCCPICNEELECKHYEDSKGNLVHIYTHDNSCPFIGFEFVSKDDLDGFVEYLRG